MPRKMPFERLIRTWALPGAIIATSLLAVFLGDETAMLLRYDRTAIAAGEFYRLLSGHFVHLGLQHYLLNAAGLLLVWYLVGSAYPTAIWCLIIASGIMFINVGFWFGMPGLEWYVGLSGVLHGMLAAGVVGVWRARRTEASIIAIMLVVKLAYESLVGPLPGSENTAGGAVIIEAHLLGALGGFAAGLWYSIRVRPAAPI